MTSLKARLAVASTIVLMCAGQGVAQSGSDFFSGRTIDFIVATDAGGGYDTYGRLIAEYMQHHLPGSTIVVRNMPGAGHLIGANFIYASEPDGTTIGTFNTGLIYQQLIGLEGVQFDLAEMSWIGKAASDARVIMVSTLTDIEDWDDLVNSETRVNFASAGVGSAAHTETTLLVDILDLPAEVISGYGGNEGELAMMRGEIQATMGQRSSFASFVEGGDGRLIAQIGGSETDVPQLADLVDPDNTNAQNVLALVASQADLVRFVAGPPGIPEDRLEALRDAFDAAMADPDLLARAEQLGIPIEPMSGGEMEAAIADALDQDEDIVAFLRETLLD